MLTSRAVPGAPATAGAVRLRHALVWLAGMATVALVGPAAANCTSPLEVPVAEVGLTVSFQGERIEGVLPTLLRELGLQLGCQFQLRQVPRARLQSLFDAGQVDLLLPASRTPARDKAAEFVPLAQNRPALISLGRSGPPLEHLADLTRPDSRLRLVVVRGHDYGPVYRQALEQLQRQRRLTLEATPDAVLRALRSGLADLTLLAPSIVIGALSEGPVPSPLLAQLRIEPVSEMGWNETGIYLSRSRLPPAERQMIREALSRAVASGQVWQLYLDAYPPRSLDGHMRPLP